MAYPSYLCDKDWELITDHVLQKNIGTVQSTIQSFEGSISKVKMLNKYAILQCLRNQCKHAYPTPYLRIV